MFHCTGQAHVVHDKHQAEVRLKLLATGDGDQPAATVVQQAVPEDVVAVVADLLLLYVGVALQTCIVDVVQVIVVVCHLV